MIQDISKAALEKSVSFLLKFKQAGKSALFLHIGAKVSHRPCDYEKLWIEGGVVLHECHKNLVQGKAACPTAGRVLHRCQEPGTHRHQAWGWQTATGSVKSVVVLKDRISIRELKLRPKSAL